MLNRIRQLLKKQQEEAAVSGWKAPFHVETINRTPKYEQEYALWKAGNGPFEVLRDWKFAYQSEKMGSSLAGALKLMQKPSANGFIIYEHPVEPHISDYLFDLLKERVVELGYVSYNNDRRIFEEKTHIKSIDRYYLKPKPIAEDFEGKRRQLYGNILIELQKKDQQPQYLKFLSTTFSDFKYHDAYPFDQLMDKMLD